MQYVRDVRCFDSLFASSLAATLGMGTECATTYLLYSADRHSKAQITEVSRSIMVVEYQGTGMDPNVNSTSSANGCLDPTNHLGTTNWLFVDSHVKALKPTASVKAGNMWANDPTNTPVHQVLSDALAHYESRMK